MGKKARRKAPQRYRPPHKSPNDPGEPPAAAPESENESPQEQQPDPKLPDPDPKLPDDGRLKCRHLKRGLSLEKLGEKLTSFSTVSLVCPACKKNPKASSGKKKKQLRKRKQDFDSSSLWICLACGNVGCARGPDNDLPEEKDHNPFANGHALEHSRRLRHPLALQMGDALSIWCFDCNATIASQAELVNGLESLGALQQAVEVIQGIFYKKTSSPREFREKGGESVHLQPEKNGVVKGLINLGNTCFFNSVMQNLVAIRGLRDYFLTEVTDGEGPLTSALRRFYREFTGEVVVNEQRPREKNSNTYNPKGLFGAICSKAARFSGHQQQDSHELLRYLLDGLHVEEEGLRRGEAGGKQETFVDKFFGGEFESTVICCECGYSSSVLEPFHDVSLPIPVPEGGGGGAGAAPPPSKRELKAKRIMIERRKRSLMAKAGGEAGRSKAPAQSSKAASEPRASGSGAAEEASSWLDYVGDDFVDVSLREPDQEIDLQATDTSITAAAAAAAEKPANTGGPEPEPELLQAPDTSTTPEPESSTTEAADESTTTTTLVESSGASTTTALLQPGALQKTGEAVAAQITRDELAKVLGKLMPLHDPGAPPGSGSALIPGEEEEQKPVAEPSGSCEEPSGEVDEALRSAPAVIALPYYEDQVSCTGWEIVPAPGEGESDEGIAGLFHEEEEAPVVLGCANRDGTGAEAAAPVHEEAEELVERRILPMTLEGCLVAFTKLEVLSGDNAWQCSNCSKQEQEKEQEQGDDDAGEVTSRSSPQEEGEGNPEEKGRRSDKKKRGKKEEEAASSCSPVLRNATKSLAIRKAPPVLTVHLKRFAQDIRGKLSKLTGHVAFDELLNLSQFHGGGSRESGESCGYRLVGVVEHSGTLRGGHYVAYVRVEAPDAKLSFWYCISDSSVWKVTLEQVLRSEAYLLFYERV